MGKGEWGIAPGDRRVPDRRFVRQSSAQSSSHLWPLVGSCVERGEGLVAGEVESGSVRVGGSGERNVVFGGEGEGAVEVHVGAWVKKDTEIRGSIDWYRWNLSKGCGMYLVGRWGLWYQVPRYVEGVVL
jgi:hypothetical protein